MSYLVLVNTNLRRGAVASAIFRKAAGSSLLRQGALVFLSSMILSAAGFGFHAIVSRKLGVVEYGSFYAAVSLYSIAGLPGALATMVVARLSSEFQALHDDEHVRSLISDITRSCKIGAAIYLVTFILFYPFLSAYAHLPQWVVPFIGVMVSVSLFSGQFRSLLQGTQDYFGFASSLVAEGAGKLLAIVLFVTLTGGLLGALAALLTGIAAGALVAARRLAKRYRNASRKAITYDWRRIVVVSSGVGALTITMTLVGSVDVILVNHAFPAREAGLYAAASLAGKIVLYFVGFIPTVMLPQVTNRHVRGLRTRGTLGSSVAMLVMLGGVGIASILFFGARIIGVLVGNQFLGSAAFLPYYGVAMVFLALTNLLGSYGVATHRVAFAAPLVALVALMLAVIAFERQSVLAVVQTFMVGNALMCLSVTIALTIEGLRAIGRRESVA